MLGSTLLYGLLATWACASAYGLRRAGALDPSSLADARYAPRVDLGLIAAAAILAGLCWAACTVVAAMFVARAGVADKDLGLLVATVAGYVMPVTALALMRRHLVSPAGPPAYVPLPATPGAGDTAVLDYHLAHGPPTPMSIGRQVLSGIFWLFLTAPWVYGTLILTDFLLRKFNVTIPTEHDLIRLLRGGEGRKLAPFIVLSAGLLAPVFEELLFRGLIQSLFAALFVRLQPANATGGRLLAITVTSLLFALMHPRFSWPAIFVLSLGLGYLYERTGRLGPSIVMHATFNLISLVLTMAGWS